jgi:hypothetical protein
VQGDPDEAGSELAHDLFCDVDREFVRAGDCARMSEEIRN